MTKKLEELFDLPQAEEPIEEVVEPTQELVTLDAMSNLEKIDAALPAIKGLDAADKEMDDIAELAIASYKDLIDLGMNVEARVACEILGSASQFLGHAITARNAKINKKLKMIDLQLKKAKMDADGRKSGDEGSIPTGEGQMLDRNELLAEVLKQAKAEEDNKKD